MKEKEEAPDGEKRGNDDVCCDVVARAKPDPSAKKNVSAKKGLLRQKRSSEEEKTDETAQQHSISPRKWQSLVILRRAG